MSHLIPAKQRQFAVEVVEQLRAGGFAAYWAGGCVRDQMLHRTPWDYDVATNAVPDEIRRLFGHRRTLAIGAAFGVITVIGPAEAGQVEVTTFRRDAAYSDGRHPDRVVFSSPEEDAQRRDFTINGMFYDPLAAEVIDYVGGQEDLRLKIVRAIGQPRERFTEDKLRMLRAVRFAAIFGFELEPATLAAIQEMAAEVTVVSAERIAGEIEIMLLDRGRARAVELLQRAGLLAAILPEIAGGGDRGQGAAAKDEENAGDEPWRRTLALLEALAEPTLPVALGALLHGAGSPKLAAEVGKRWRMAKKPVERAEWLLENYRLLAEARRMPWSRLQPLLIHEGIVELLALGDALAKIGRLDAEEVAYCRHRLAVPPAELNPPPLLTGDDLIARGVPRGKIYARMLREVRDAQLDGVVKNRDEALALVDRSLAEVRGAEGGTV